MLGHGGMTLRDSRAHGFRRRSSAPTARASRSGWVQRKVWSTTWHFGTKGALSRSSKGRSSPSCVERVAEDVRVPFQLADVRFRVRVEQQLVRIEAMARLRARTGRARDSRTPRPASGPDTIDVPDLIGVFGQFDALDFLLAGFVEQAQFDFRRVRGKQREIDAFAVPGRAERETGSLRQCGNCWTFLERSKK